MSLERHKRIDTLFQAALELPPEERDAFLRAECADDEALQAEISELIRAAEDPASDDLLSSSRDRLLADYFEESEQADDLSGTTVGHWHLQKPIGRGGIGTVYVACRSDGEFEQKAALKVLRRGLDTDDLVARFRAERQILSTLEHPAIARLLDGGALPDGRPYLVIEYVDGIAINQYCLDNDLSVRDRVELMIRVLQALHHAHKHLVVHRDIKPSNILVTENGKVTLLDFGIAKILDPESIAGVSTMTRTGVSLMTPGYGSPEQFAGQAITTVSDIYQAGLVLYELLVGHRVTPKGDTSTHQLSPSQAVTNRAERKAIKGDLDAIVRKSTHGDPGQRYSSANDMLVDLQRYLAGLPVLAQPDSVSYRAKKLFRRRPWLLPAVLAGVIGIAVYVATITVYSNRAAEQEQLAVASQQFLIDLFRSPDPFNPASASAGSGITVLQALELGRERIDSELGDQPKLKASLLNSIADVYTNLDRQKDVIALREEAMALEREIYGDESPQVATTLRGLVPQYRAAGETERATRYANQQLELAQAVYADTSAEYALAEIAMGGDLLDAGDLAGARQWLEQGLDRLRPHRHEYPSEMISGLIDYATSYDSNNIDFTFDAIEEADSVARDAFGENSLRRASVQIRLASSLTLVEDYAGALRNFEEALPVLEAQLGEDHSSTLTALNNMAFMEIRGGGNQQRAEEILTELLIRQTRVFGIDSRGVADTSQNLGALYARQSRYEEALPLLTRAHNNFKALLNEDNYVIGYPLLTIAYSNLQLERPAEAERAAREALELFARTRTDSDVHGVSQCLLGVSLERQGLTEEGAALVLDSHAKLRSGFVGDNYKALCRLE